MFHYFADIITYDLFNLIKGDQLTNTVNYFLYDIFKILFLIFIVVTVIAFIRSFFDPNKFKKSLLKLPFGLGNLGAAIFGAVTPFCSCSSIPLFIGFIESRLPIGIAFSFLITSPLVNEVAFVIMGGLFGWKLAFIYAISGIALGVIGGIIIGALKMEKEVILEDIEEGKMGREMPKTIKKKIIFAINFGWWTFKKLLPYIIGGVAIGSAIHGYVPQEFFMNTIGKFEILSVPIAALVGIPIYAGCSTVVPIIFSITANGVPLGTSLAFMMGIAGLSLPEAVMLKRILSFKLLATFFGLVSAGIVVIGYLFNFLS